MERSNSIPNKREYYIDILRVVCIVLVIFNHTRQEGFELYTCVKTASFDYWVSLFLAILCKIGVPVFFMISGVTILSKEEDLKSFFRKRVLRFALVILLFTFLQYLRIYRVHPEAGFSLKTWIVNVYSGNIISPYWFLKAYFSFLLIVPVLRVLVKNMEKKLFKYLIILKGVESVVTLIFIYTGYGTNFSFPFNTDILFYPMMGYYLGCVEKEEKANAGWIYGVACILITALVTVWDTLFYRRTNAHTGGTEAFTWILALLFFMCFKNIKIQKKSVQTALATMGGAVFGTYLIEDVVRNQFEFIYPILTPLLGRISTAVLFSLISAATGLIIIGLLRLIPWVRKLI